MTRGWKCHTRAQPECDIFNLGFVIFPRPIHYCVSSVNCLSLLLHHFCRSCRALFMLYLIHVTVLLYVDDWYWHWSVSSSIGCLKWWGQTSDFGSCFMLPPVVWHWWLSGDRKDIFHPQMFSSGTDGGRGPEVNRTTHIHLEKELLNGSSGSSCWWHLNCLHLVLFLALYHCVSWSSMPWSHKTLAFKVLKFRAIRFLVPATVLKPAPKPDSVSSLS